MSYFVFKNNVCVCFVFCNKIATKSRNKKKALLEIIMSSGFTITNLNKLEIKWPEGISDSAVISLKKLCWLLNGLSL